jgi:hypothetical protein
MAQLAADMLDRVIDVERDLLARLGHPTPPPRPSLRVIAADGQD